MLLVSSRVSTLGIMDPSDYQNAPRNTNGVGKANSSAKSGGQKQSLYAAMESPYEKDKL